MPTHTIMNTDMMNPSEAAGATGGSGGSASSVAVTSLPSLPSGSNNIGLVTSPQFSDTFISGSISALNANLTTGTATTNSVVSLNNLTNKGVATIQVTGTWVGTLVGQYSIDGTNWVTLGSTSFLNVNTGAYTSNIASASVGIWTIDISGVPNFRISTSAYTSGTAVVSINATQSAQMFALDNPIPAGTNIIGGLVANQTVGISQIGATAVSTITDATAAAKGLGVSLNGPATVTDKASAAVTATGNTGTISDGFGQTLSALVNITAVSGTSPTMDLVLQESYDNGTTWQDVYHCPRFTAATTFSVPNITIGGRRRWLYTIAGTSPSFTFSIIVMRGSHSPIIARSFYDRTLASTQTLSTSTAAFDISGCKNIVMSICSGTATTACAITMQFSQDGSNWFSASSALTSVASSTVAVAATTGYAAKYVRGLVTTAGATQTLTYINFYGSN